MLSKEENEFLTQVGPGTPAGALLRRYWQPVATVSDLTTEKPKKRLKVLGEDLVLFRDGNGRYGLVGEHCSHRAASLYYGTVEDDGIRCAYHGWKYDINGKCLEQPFEPKDSAYKDEICHPAYRVEKLAGLLFAYMGPKPAPLLPRWDLLLREDGVRKIIVLPAHRCNWLQAMENSVDPVHTYYLHAHQFKIRGLPVAEYYYRPIGQFQFEEVRGPVWAGLIKRRTFEAGEQAEGERGHPLIFPNMLYVPQGPNLVIHWRVPIDDGNTYIVWLSFTPSENGQKVEQPEDAPVEYLPRPETPEGEYEMTSFPGQDMMAWETQGRIFDRTRESLGHTDKGITLYRKLLREQIKAVQNGGEPLGIIRDPAKNKMIGFEVSSGAARKEYVEGKADYYSGRPVV